MGHEVPTFCRVCEPACGLVATVEGGKLVKLAPDRDHPISQGFACPKGLAGVEINHDPDRLNFPLHRTSDGELERSTWDESIPAIAGALRRILDQWGPAAVATYGGNPAAFNSHLGIGIPDVLRRLGVHRWFSAVTQDCANKYAASNAMFGSPHIHPIPDVDSADMVLLFGSNWRTSKASWVSLPAPYAKLMAAARRGTKIRFINPRVTESSTEQTGPTLQIRPDTDVYLLAALIHEIDKTVGFHPDATRFGKNVAGLRGFVADYPPERAARVCGVETAEIVKLAGEFAKAPSAAVHMSVGTNQGRQGTLAYWLMHMLSLVTGNLDRQGGNVFAPGWYDMGARTRSDFTTGTVVGEFGTMRSTELPGGLLASYILDSAEPIRALFVNAGNPLLSIPGYERLKKAFESLELLVVVDIYPNATAEYAHWLLPATDQFERADIGFAGNMRQARSWIQLTPRVVEAQHERKEEWWFYARLAQEMNVSSVLDAEDWETSRWSKVDHMLKGSGVTRADLEASERGLPLPAEITYEQFLASEVQTADGLVDCFPAGFSPAIAQCAAHFEEYDAQLTAHPDQLRLINRRDSRMHNSWYMNVAGTKRGTRTENRLAMNPRDAHRRGLEDGQRVTVASKWGELDTTIELDTALRQGVVSMEHGWGLQSMLRLSRRSPGVNVNVLLPHGPDSYDPLSNQQHMTGIPVTVRADESTGIVTHEISAQETQA